MHGSLPLRDVDLTSPTPKKCVNVLERVFVDSLSPLVTSAVTMSFLYTGCDYMGPSHAKVVPNPTVAWWFLAV